MKSLRNYMNQVLNVLAGGSFFAMVVFTCWQVFARYLLRNPSSWSEELVSYLFAWMALFGASIVAGERGHMNIPILVERFGERTRTIFAVLSEGIAILFSGVILVYGGIRITNLAMGQMTSSLGIAIGFFYLALPISGILNMIYAGLNIMEILGANDEKEG